MGKGNMQRRNINNKKQGRNGGTLWGADRKRRKDPRGTLEEEPAGPARGEGLDPSYDVVGDAFGAGGLAEDAGIHTVEPTFDVQKEKGDLAAGVSESADRVDKSGACVVGGERGERATLVGVKEAYVAGDRRKSGSGNSFKDLGDGLEEDDDSERGWGVVRGLTGFIQYHAVRLLEGGGVVAKAKQGSKEGCEHGRSNVVHCLPNRVGDPVGARGRGGGAGPNS